MAAGGITCALLLVLRFGYPVSMVGVPGEARTNSHPPSLLVPALAAFQSGLAILLRERIATVLRGPGRWAAVALTNLNAMTIFCWHQIALVVLSVTALVLVPAGLPGLHDSPTGLGWVLHRLAWFPIDAAVLGGCVMLARRFEQPRRESPGR